MKGYGTKTGQETKWNGKQGHQRNKDTKDRSTRGREGADEENHERVSSADFHHVSVFLYYIFMCVLFELSYFKVCNSNFSLFSVCNPSLFYRMRFYCVEFYCVILNMCGIILCAI